MFMFLNIILFISFSFFLFGQKYTNGYKTLVHEKLYSLKFKVITFNT
jgi:hypothetical protein